MKKLLLLVVCSGCVTTAAGVRREAAARVAGCQNATVDQALLTQDCKDQGANYCKKNGQDKNCWVDEYTINVMDQDPGPDWH